MGSQKSIDVNYISDTSSFVYRFVKRLFDVIFSFFFLIVFSPVMLIIAILVKSEDGGSIIYCQERIGRHGKPFIIYKFRSMRVDAEPNGPQLCNELEYADSRLTGVGRFIRHHHLDELPQFWNVLKGDMAMVGPRPERKFYIDQIMEHDSRYAYLYQLRPGITSYATLYNGYTDTMDKMLKRLSYDLDYLSHHNLWIDFVVLFKTVSVIVFGRRS